MSNRGGIDSSIQDYLEADHQVLFMAIKAEFDTETIRAWTGDYDLSIGGATYLGVGNLLSISNIGAPKSISVSLIISSSFFSYVSSIFAAWISKAAILE